MARNIEADIRYFKPLEPIPPGVRPDFGRLNLVPEHLPVTDMRGSESQYSVDDQGFAIVKAPSQVKDFHDGEELDRVYVPEVAELLKSVTGGTEAIVSGGHGLVRVSKRAGTPIPGTAGTGDFVHIDLSENAGIDFLRRGVPADEVERRSKRRYSIFNVWRPFTPPPQDVPLALCDARTVSPQDLVHCHIKLGDMEWENIAPVHNAAHRWFYYSDMTRDDAYVFRSFDTDPDKQVCVPHTAFEDTECPPDAAPRRSIEIRFFVFYD